MTITWDAYRRWLNELAPNFDPPQVSAPKPNRINRDSRSIVSGDFYLALKGERFDGHDFIAEAMKKGAVCFLYDDPTKVSEDLIRYGVRVNDTLAALQRIGKGYLSTLKAKKIAITGSVGKTTCKQLTTCILEKAGRTLASPASFNNEIGVPLTMLSALPEHDFIVFECGARHSSDIQFLVELIQPNVGVVLNVKSVHTGEFGGYEKILQTKTEMFTHAPNECVLIAPQDQKEVLAVAHTQSNKVVSFGVDKESDVRVVEKTWQKDSSLQVTYLVKDKSVSVTYADGNEALMINGAAAASVAYALSLPLGATKEGLSAFKAGEGRFKIHRHKDHVVVDDSYNASPASMLSGFKSCQQLFSSQQIVAVLGDMRELGEESKQAHYDVGRHCYDIMRPDLLITIGAESYEIGAGAASAGLAKENILSLQNIEQALDLPIETFLSRDVVYLKGSNAMNLEKLVKHLLEVRT